MTTQKSIIGFRNKGTNEEFKDAGSMVLDAQKRYKELMDLTYCDIECVVKEPDEDCWLILDECGNWNYFPDDHYEILFAKESTPGKTDAQVNIEEIACEKLSHIPDISARDIYCFELGFNSKIPLGKAEQRIKDVIEELEKRKESLEVFTVGKEAGIIIGYEEALALLRGEE